MSRPPTTLRAVADLLGATVEGDDSVRIESLAALDEAGPGQLTFALDARRAARLADTNAAAAIVGPQAPVAAIPLLRVADVQAAVAMLLEHWAEEEDLPAPGRHPSALVCDDAELGEGVAVGANVVVGSHARVGPRTVLCANVFLGAGAEIGADCVLFPGAVVQARCALGDRVRVGPNAVIGYDGFGYYQDKGVHRRIRHIGRVVIEDDVDLGACACVDRAKFGVTRIGAGTKIDNLVQVAHNVRIGRGCLLAAQAGIAGSARLGEYVVLGGNAGVRDGATLGDGVQAAAFAAIANDVPAGEAVVGVPARPARLGRRIIQAWTKLPELLRRVKSLEKRLKALESATDD